MSVGNRHTVPNLGSSRKKARRPKSVIEYGQANMYYSYTNTMPLGSTYSNSMMNH